MPVDRAAAIPVAATRPRHISRFLALSQAFQSLQVLIGGPEMFKDRLPRRPM